MWSSNVHVWRSVVGDYLLQPSESSINARSRHGNFLIGRLSAPRNELPRCTEPAPRRSTTWRSTVSPPAACNRRYFPLLLDRTNAMLPRPPSAPEPRHQHDKVVSQPILSAPGRDSFHHHRSSPRRRLSSSISTIPALPIAMKRIFESPSCQIEVSRKIRETLCYD